jgi:Bacterial regulatory helix-turn-helix protein, lysR family
MIDFTSRQLRAFLLVAQHCSFSRAGGALFITPSGLSVLIRELETQLGVRLFERTTRHVALTPFGDRAGRRRSTQPEGAGWSYFAHRAIGKGNGCFVISRVARFALRGPRLRTRTRHHWSAPLNCGKYWGFALSTL